MDIFVLNEKFQMVDCIDSYESLIWADRYQECGDFEIYTPINEKIRNLLQLNRYVQIEGSDHTMIIEGIKIESDAENGDYITVTGRSIESLLERRIVWEQTTLDGYLEGQIEKLLNQNVINPSIDDRRIEKFIFEKSGNPEIEDMKISSQFTGDNLYDVLVSICKNFDIGFQIILDETDRFVFKLYKGSDKSFDQISNPYVLFSPDLENIISSDYDEDIKTIKTVNLVAGEGEGKDRKTLVVGDQNKKGISRYELYTDARDITQTEYDNEGNEIKISDEEYSNLLKNRGEEKLLEYKETKEFNGKIDTSRLYKYKKDFFLGDIIQLENVYGIEARGKIVEYTYHQSTSSFEEYPIFDIIT